MKHIFLILPALVLFGCQSERTNTPRSAGLIAYKESEYLLSEVQADSLTISNTFTDQCSTAVFSFHNSKGIYNAQPYPDSPMDPQWDYTFDLYKKIDSILMKKNMDVHAVDIQYQEDNKEIYRLTINKRKCADSLQIE